jgi:GNAT superfamily N-acetyltransferase
MSKDTQINNVRIAAYSAAYQADFERLNIEWLEKFFYVEENDQKQLRDPEAYFIKTGGYIFIALLNEVPVGTAALIKVGVDTFELAKMSVTESAKGNGIGEALARRAMEQAKSAGAKMIFLLTNSALVPARRLYEKLGFVAVPVDDAHGYARCDVKMELYFSQ